MTVSVSWIAHEIYLWMINDERTYKRIRQELVSLARQKSLTAENTKIIIENHVTAYAGFLEQNGKIPPGSRFKRGVISGAARELGNYFRDDVRMIKQGAR